MEPSSYPNFVWRQTSTGRWEREIDEVEQFYTTLARRFQGTGRTFFAMTAHISFSVLRTEKATEVTEVQITNALRMAWLQLRYEHPTIASWVEYNHEEKKCKKVYEMFSDSEDIRQSAWLAETFKIVSTRQSCQDWCNSDPPVPKLPTLYLIKHPVSPVNAKFTADIVLRSHHDIIDGIGSLHMLNGLFKSACHLLHNQNGPLIPRFGNEWKNLSPPFRVAASIPVCLTPEQEARYMQILKKNTLLRENAEIATVPVPSVYVVPGRHQRVSLTLNLEETQKLLLACKDIGVSVTHVYHAAIALVLRDIQARHSEERKVRYISYALVNQRGHCKAPYNTSQHAVSVYHSGSGHSLAIDLTVLAKTSARQTAIERNLEFAKVVELVKEYYHQIRNDQEHVFMIPSYWSHSTPPYPAEPGVPPIPAPNKMPSASISSLGVIDNIINPKHGRFELSDPWVTGEELGPGLGLFLGTFRKQISLSAAYNDAWHEKQKVMDFMNSCNALVLNYLVG